MKKIYTLVLCLPVFSCQGLPRSLGDMLPSSSIDNQFYMESDDGRRVPMKIIPERLAEFLAKLHSLSMIEKKARDECPPGTSVSFLPGYSYELIWIQKDKTGKTIQKNDFFVRGRTLGGYTVYILNADPYFTPQSWKVAERRLKTDIDFDLDKKESELWEEEMPE